MAHLSSTADDYLQAYSCTGHGDDSDEDAVSRQHSTAHSSHSISLADLESGTVGPTALQSSIRVETLTLEESARIAAIFRNRTRSSGKGYIERCCQVASKTEEELEDNDDEEKLTHSELSSGDESSSDSSSGPEASRKTRCRSTPRRAVSAVCRCLIGFIQRKLPILLWLPSLDMATVRADTLAGLTVGVMAIPQSMAYAKIAGLDFGYGLYAACLPTFIYAIFGQSRQLAVGPVAMVSLLVQAGLHGKLTEEQCPEWYAKAAIMAPEDLPSQSEVCADAYAGLAFLTAFTAGLIMTVGSVVQISFLVNFLGHPVISGFTTGAAVTIALSQVKYILGVKIPKDPRIYITLEGIIEELPNTKFMPLLLGLVWFAFLFGAKKITQKKKENPYFKMLGPLSPLVSCLVGILVLKFVPSLISDYHIKIVDTVPSGLFKPSLWALDMSMLPAVMSTSVSAALVGYMESIAIAKTLAMNNRYEIDAGQEMLALGLANMAGSMFSCYPVTGSFSRSAVANSTGAKSQLAGLITAMLILCTMLFLTPLFYYLPMFALAAIVINSAMSLIACDQARHLWHVSKRDFSLWMIAMLGTLLIGPLEGIIIAVIISLLLIIHESVRPQIAVLWRVPGTAMYRPIKQESSGVFVPGVLTCRIGASMYFANASYVKDTLLASVADIAEVDTIEYLVLEMTPVISIDSTAAHVLKDIVKDFRMRGMQVAFAMVGNRVEKTIRKAGLRDFIGESWFFPSVNEAVSFCMLHRHASAQAAAGVGDLPDMQALPSNGARSPTDVTHTLKQSNEVGFSNSVHHTCTVVYITLEREYVGIVTAITAAFATQNCFLVRAQIDGTKHTYFAVESTTGAKLRPKPLEALKMEINGAIAQVMERKENRRPRGYASTSAGSVNTAGASPLAVAVASTQNGSASGRELELQMELAGELARIEEGRLAQARAAQLQQQLVSIRGGGSDSAVNLAHI
eukprot:TRINITY_DN22659_c0_g1_i1.p1 TRINITY_DN22659_c0_g1~~TRINITY_DN22659_c0_g1_i1.p1  ORF type:complete len:967 (+),score=207.39 TRINITY_DN22659_c0_g1_i1:81-2981(+)